MYEILKKLINSAKRDGWKAVVRSLGSEAVGRDGQVIFKIITPRGFW